MTEQEIIEFAKTNDYCWDDLKRRNPEVAEWMEKHWKECVCYVVDKIWVKKDSCRFYSAIIYRLRPDYELPKSQRWWFDTITKEVFESNVDSVPPEYPLEVTADYAKELQNKPDDECELRKVKSGDIYFDGMAWRQAINDNAYNDQSDRGYRWCKTQPSRPGKGSVLAGGEMKITEFALSEQEVCLAVRDYLNRDQYTVGDLQIEEVDDVTKAIVFRTESKGGEA